MPSKRITPSGLQLPSTPVGASQIFVGGPPVTSIFLSLPSATNAEEPAVGRPEGAPRSLRSGQRLRRERVERPEPDLGLASRIGRIEGEHLSVGGDFRSVDRRDCRRIGDLEPNDARRLRRAAEETVGRAPRRRAATPPRRPRPASRGSCAARRRAPAAPRPTRPPRPTGAGASRRAPCSSGARAPSRDSP